MKQLFKIILILLFSGRLFSQNADSVSIGIKLPINVYFNSPCLSICFDTIYQSADTLFLIFPDDRVVVTGFKIHKKRDTNFIAITKDDSIRKYGAYSTSPYRVYKHVVKKHNIQFLIPSHYVDYRIIVLKFPYDADDVYFLKKKRKNECKYLGKKKYQENKLYKREKYADIDYHLRGYYWKSKKMYKNMKNQQREIRKNTN